MAKPPRHMTRVECAECVDLAKPGKRPCATCLRRRASVERATRRDTLRRARIMDKSAGHCARCERTDGLRIYSLNPAMKVQQALRWGEERFELFMAQAAALCDEHAYKHLRANTPDGKIIGIPVGHGEGRTGKKGCYCALCGPLKQERRRDAKVVDRLFDQMFSVEKRRNT